jgi:hypothetical protein
MKAKNPIDSYPDYALATADLRRLLEHLSEHETRWQRRWARDLLARLAN